MNKKLFFGACAALFLGTGVVTATRIFQNAGKESGMLQANIEAMADGEVDAGYVKSRVPRWGDEPGFWTEDGSKFCVPHWESVECWDEAPDGQWCQSSYHRSVHCY